MDALADPRVLAAVVAAVTAVLLVVIQHGVYAKRLVKQRERHAENLEEIRRDNFQKLADHARLSEETKEFRESRRIALERHVDCQQRGGCHAQMQRC